MQVSQVLIMKIKNETDRILHMRGNNLYTAPGSNKKILEFSVVVDKSLPAECVSSMLIALMGALKRHDEVYRNVRLNYVQWEADDKTDHSVVPMMQLMSEGFYASYETNPCEKSYDKLYAYLKKFHARSRIVFLLTSDKNIVVNEEETNESLKPFLGKRLVKIQYTNGEPELCCRMLF